VRCTSSRKPKSEFVFGSKTNPIFCVRQRKRRQNQGFVTNGLTFAVLAELWEQLKFQEETQ
jgi:hypothetical protein